MASKPNADDNAVRVMVRVRLFNGREMDISTRKKEKLRPCVRMRGNTCAVIEYFKDEKGYPHEREREAFEYSECFWSIPTAQYASDNAVATQLSVYEKSGKMALQHALQGFNVCVFAYGQTGSGKTFSMLGSDAEPGISPRLVDDLFVATAKRKELQPSLHIVVEIMFFEIYNEKVRDLFNKQSKSGDYEAPRIRTHRTRGVYVDGLFRKEVTDAETTKALIEKGTKERAMAETKMNAHSSRSHAVFQICITTKDPLRGTQCTSLVNLVDLAGSEKISLSGVTGQAMKEAMNINKSLSTLRRVFDVLIENTQQKKQMVPPFRDSVLTHVLTDSLGGNSKTQMLATISPHEANLEDTLQTLRYANQAKAIVCDARVNEEKSAEMVEAMKDEIEKLRRMMAEGVAVGGSSIGGEVAMSPEMARELQEKEAEFTRMMDEQAEMKREQERMKEEQAKKEAEMQELQQNIKEMVDVKQQMDVTLTQQKSERFAAAFRNAYLLSKEKKSNQAQVAELTDLRARVDGMTSRLRILEEDMQVKSQEVEELKSENERLHGNIDDDRAVSRRTITELETRRRDLENLCETLDGKVQMLEGELHGLLDNYDASQSKVDRLEMELGGYMVAAERESIEKGRIKEAFHKTVLRSNDEMDAVRRRKEKYKREATEEKSKVQSFTKAIDTFRGDRDSYSETIRAQQSLLNEKIFLLDAMQSELDSVKKRERQFKAMAEERLETIRILNESVQQYQDASLKFMTDITMKDKEIDRLRALVEESRSFVSAQSSSSNRILRGVPVAHVDPTSPARPRSPAIGYRARSTNLGQPLVQDLSRSYTSTLLHSPMRRV